MGLMSSSDDAGRGTRNCDSLLLEMQKGVAALEASWSVPYKPCQCFPYAPGTTLLVITQRSGNRRLHRNLPMEAHSTLIKLGSHQTQHLLEGEGTSTVCCFQMRDTVPC